jgi:shikimate dehydrogenase
MKRLAVIGQPIAHSRSPRMHNAALRELGLAGEWGYEAIELAPEQFADGVRRLIGEGFVGANVTIPHKQAALKLADRVSAAAAEIGAANTLTFADGSIRAENTDAPGLLAALETDPQGKRAIVLGAGGAGRGAVWALREAGAEVAVWNRTAERADELAAELGVESLGGSAIDSLAGVGLVVNATAIGLDPASGAGSVPGRPGPDSGYPLKDLPFAVDQVGDQIVVVDLVYGATETELVRVARERGAHTVDGLEVLVRQGAASFEIWTGLEAPLATMRRAVRPESDDSRT